MARRKSKAMSPAEIDAYLASLPPGMVQSIRPVCAPATSPDKAGETETAKPAKSRPKRGEVELVPPLCVSPGPGKLIMLLPLETKSETNQRQWQARSRRNQKAWRVVRSVARLDLLAPFEAHWRQGREIDVVLVRLGGRQLDPLVNLPSSMKGVEDALAYLLGINDNSPLWKPRADEVLSTEHPQVGVRVELTCRNFEDPLATSGGCDASESDQGKAEAGDADHADP
jgi:hypothetical protein